MLNKILRKLTSRKLWLALYGVFTGAAMALGTESTDITAVAGAATALVSVVTYIITEGKIDAESVKNAIIDIQEGIEAIERADDE